MLFYWDKLAKLRDKGWKRSDKLMEQFIGCHIFMDQFQFETYFQIKSRRPSLTCEFVLVK